MMFGVMLESPLNIIAPYTVSVFSTSGLKYVIHLLTHKILHTMTKKPNNPTPFKTVVQSLEFHNFEETPVFTGLYRSTVEVGEEEKFTANIFADVDTGEEKYVGNNYSIEKAIKTAKVEFPARFAELVFNIEFLGKTTVKGKPFNQFRIGYCLLDDYEQFIAGSK